MESGLERGGGGSLLPSPSTVIRWQPSEFNFRAWCSQKEEKQRLFGADCDLDGRGQRSQRMGVFARLTKGLVETYKNCNQQFNYSEDLNPKRFLTTPSVGVLNDGYDNANSDLILAANLVLINHESQRRYIVKDVLGQGTFGQVAKCWVPDSGSFVAVKIIKNQPAYYQQAWVEVSILTTLNLKYDPEDKHHIVRIYDHFVYHRHLCIVFELLDTNLFELVKLNHFMGLSLNIVQLFSKQILRGLCLLKDAAVIHCDLKPENILLCKRPAREVKIIDFGSACTENRTVYSYIQSRYYRSPEVLLGYQYTTAIDMWSFGCIVAELFLGLPLFPGASEFDLLKRMIKILGGQPPDYVLSDAKNTSKFFKFVGNANHEEYNSRQSAFQALTEDEYEARELKKPSVGKEYFKQTTLEAIITKYPYRNNLPEDIAKEAQVRLALIDFLKGLVEFDPEKRWSPLQASKHPFVTGEPFTSPYKPPPETPRMTVMQNMRVDHNPAGGHWFAAGLSPNISDRPRVAMHNSPHFQMLPYGYSGSYGSLGSHGSSYTEGPVHGSSYGSYGDNSNMLPYYSPAGPSWLKPAVAMPGNSPDSRRRVNFPAGSGLGVSPSVGNFAPMSLGTSPSQFTPPGSYGHMSAGSPGQFGPTSPARGSHGSPFGKIPGAVNQFNRRKNWPYSGNLHSEGSGSSPSHWHRQASDSSFSGQTELHLQPKSNASSGQQQGGDSRMSNGYSSTHKHDKHESTAPLPDPGDWDPNYSEELLLEDDKSDLSSVTADFSNGMQLGQGLVTSEPPVHVRRSNHLSRSSISSQRPNGPIQAFSGGEMGSPPSAHNLHGHPMTKPPAHFMSHMQQSAPSRFGQQQPGQRINQMRPHGSEWNHMNFHPPSSIYSSADPQLHGNGSFTNGAPWGNRSNHSNASIPPASRGRKNYGRVAQ